MIALYHKCELIKFKHAEDDFRHKEELPDDSEDPDKWFCNGGSDEEGFIGGCKSG